MKRLFLILAKKFPRAPVTIFNLSAHRFESGNLSRREIQERGNRKMTPTSILENLLIETVSISTAEVSPQTRFAPATNVFEESIAIGEIAAVVLMLILIVVAALTVVFGVLEVSRLLAEANQNPVVRTFLTGQI